MRELALLSKPAMAADSESISRWLFLPSISPGHNGRPFLPLICFSAACTTATSSLLLELILPIKAPRRGGHRRGSGRERTL